MPLTHTVKEVQLKNGAKGLFIFVPGVASVHYEVQFRAGNNYAARPEIGQVAHVLEHMAFATNEEYPSIELFSQEFTKNGAYSNAFTGSINLTYVARAGIMEWEKIIELEELSLTRPLYTQQLLDAEKGNVREELIGYLGRDSRVLWQETMRKSGLRRWYDPEEIESIKAITLGDIKEHYVRTHTTHNMRFIIAGDLEAHMPVLLEKLESWDLPKGSLLDIEQDKAHTSGLVHLYRKESKNLAFSLRFFLNRVITQEEIQTMVHLTHILTGTFHSRIWGAARSRGICYGMGSAVSYEPTGTSDFYIGGEVGFQNANELFMLIIDQIKAVMNDGVSEQELESAKQYRLGVLQMDLESPASLANWYNTTYYETGKIDHVEDVPARIKGTTVDDIQRLAKEFIESGLWSFGGYGDISTKEMQKHYDLFAKELLKD